ncbi:MAG TPA: hypothetical protein VEH31_20925, partial [Streptosporangiaceae bacterium]|nr:hypothetical protein [Streptosporangiaceae bacterium]
MTVKPWERARSGLALLAAAVMAAGCAHASAGPTAGTPRPAGSTAAPSVAAAARPADPLAGRQLITVSAASPGATYATLTAYRRSAGHWRR